MKPAEIFWFLLVIIQQENGGKLDDITFLSDFATSINHASWDSTSYSLNFISKQANFRKGSDKKRD